MIYHYPVFRFPAVISFFMLVITFIILPACEKETSTTEVLQTGQHISVYVTGSSGKNETVWMEIVKVEAGLDTTTSSNTVDYNVPVLWKTLSMQPGVYNITALQNSTDHLLASGSIRGTVKALRYKIGVHNTVIKHGTVYPVTFFNRTDDYLYTTICSEDLLKSDENEIWIQTDLTKLLNIQMVQGEVKLWND